MRLARALLIAVAFATRIPVRVGAVTPNELGASLAALPAVGFGIGAGSFGVFIASVHALGPTLAAILAVSFAALITGGLHLDGVADWFDALGGGHGSRERMLEIMRDSRIGAHGATALVLLLLAKVAAVAELSQAQRLSALCAAPAAARLTAVWLLYGLPAAREDGLGRGMASNLTLGRAIAASASFIVVAFWFGPSMIGPSFAALVATFGVGWHARSQLGGLTGDTCGANIELVELVFLLACNAQGA